MPNPEALIAGLAIALVAAAVLALVFGFTGRTIAMAVAIALGVGLFYPGGTTELVVDVLRPLGMFVQSERDQTAARDAAVEQVAEPQATTPSR